MAEDGVGHARYTFRLRVSSTARGALMAEWDRCRWVWNECVAKSKAVHLRNKATGGKRTCGAAQLDKMLTEARKATPWLREGSSVPQQQIIRDFGKSRAKAQKDIKDRLPMARRAGAVIGIDWGVKETATTTSDTHDLPHAEQGRKAKGRLGEAAARQGMQEGRTPVSGHRLQMGQVRGDRP
ncbi:hypothetical protein GCM10022403_095530 [Streptomyces coacervatus]|uniref:Transposase n=1 Tax=Streptomyces coacervatus TaxID=647381 RepID=A0ABP7JNV5_9ACTN